MTCLISASSALPWRQRENRNELTPGKSHRKARLFTK